MAVLSNTTYAIPNYWGWTTYTPVIPKLYWDVYSQEERIKRLCKEYDKLCHYVSMLAENINETNTSIESQQKEIEQHVNEVLQEQNDKINSTLNEMKLSIENELNSFKENVTQNQDKFESTIDLAIRKIEETVDDAIRNWNNNSYVYDVTTGTYRPSYQAMRRLFQVLSFDHKGETQIVEWISNSKTVEQLAEQSVYNTAYGNELESIVNSQDMDNQIYPAIDPEKPPTNIEGYFSADMLRNSYVTRTGYVVIGKEEL